MPINFHQPQLRCLQILFSGKDVVKATIEEFSIQVRHGEKSILHNCSLMEKFVFRFFYLSIHFNAIIQIQVDLGVNSLVQKSHSLCNANSTSNIGHDAEVEGETDSVKNFQGLLLHLISFGRYTGTSWFIETSRSTDYWVAWICSQHVTWSGPWSCGRFWWCCKETHFVSMVAIFIFDMFLAQVRY